MSQQTPDRSKRYLWENFVFHFLQKLPQIEDAEDAAAYSHSATLLAANFADAMLEQWAKRWQKLTQEKATSERVS